MKNGIVANVKRCSVSDAKQALNCAVAPVSVPFLKDGEIDYKSLANLIEFIIENGSKTLLLTYGDSLYSILTDEEIADVTKAVVRQASGRAMIVAAERRWWTGKIVAFAEYVREIGADMLNVLPPDWAFSCKVDDLVAHYDAIGKEIPVLIATHLGVRPLPLDIIKVLLEQQTGLVAIKDDVCGSYARRLATLVKGRCALLSGGGKENFLDVMPYGVDGYLSAFMLFMPQIAHDFWDAACTGDIKKAVNIIESYERPFFDDLCKNADADFDALIHGAMEIAGITKRWRRKPYHSLSDEQMETVKEFVNNIGLN